MQIFIKILFSVFIIFTFLNKPLAQDCSLSESPNRILSGNNIRAGISINGSLFWDLTDAQFHLVTPNNNNSFPASIFATGVWITGKTNGNDIKTAASTYSNGNSHDYFPGPINNDNGQLSFECDNFDRSWEAYGYEISQHISDFEDDGIINYPLENIYAYPAQQNPHFENSATSTSSSAL